MRKLLPLSLFLVIGQLVLSQNAFYDAKKLSQYVRANGLLAPDPGAELDTVKAIFEKYGFRGHGTGNAVLDKFLSPGAAFALTDSQQNQFKSFLTGSIHSLGSLDVTNVADGLARFLIDRGQQELNVAFFTRFHKFLTDPDYPEFQILFPTTVEFFKTIDISRYEELIQTLREAFFKDLSNFLISINQLVDHPKYAELLEKFPEVRAALRVARIVSELSQSEEGIRPDSLIHRISMIPELANTNLGSAMNLLQIVSQSLRQNPVLAVWASERKWIRLSDFNQMMADKNWLGIYVGLLCQEMINKNVRFTKGGTTVRVADFLNMHVNTIFVFTTHIENFIQLANDVDNLIIDIKKKQTDDRITKEDYYTYISKSINIIEFGFKIANTIDPDIIGDRYILIARNGNELYKSIYTKNYTNAVMNGYKIIDEVFSKRDERVNALGLDTAIANPLKRLTIPSQKTVERILKYGNFMAAVVKAESGEEVQKAIEAAALPAGSYSIKQSAAVNLSVNGYIGYSMDFTGGLYAQGVYAPVGFSFTVGPRNRIITPTLFVGLIDVGSLALYRVQEGNTANLKQEVRLESIFAPSAQLFFGIKRFPIAFGGGWKRTPRLFYSSPSAFQVQAARDVFNVSVLVDIPLFTLLNRQFYKK